MGQPVQFRVSPDFFLPLYFLHSDFFHQDLAFLQNLNLDFTDAWTTETDILECI